MATIVTRSGKGSPLTNTEVDANFTNLNTDKLELSGGTLTGNLSLGDNVKATFGDAVGGDLQIYHDGSNSYIKEDGTGNLIVGVDDFRLMNPAITKLMIKADTDSYVKLYYDGDEKLATTSTGIDVTGSVVADGLTVSNGTNTTAIPATSDRVSFTANSSYIQSTGSFYVQPTGDLVLNGTGSEIMRLKSSKVGINNSNPATALDVTGTITADGLTVDGGTYHKVVSTFPATYTTNLQIGQQGNINNNAQTDTLLINHNAQATQSNVLFNINDKSVLKLQEGGDISFFEDQGVTPKLFWDASAEALGIGDANPSFRLDVNNTSSRVRFKAATGHSNLELSAIEGRDYLLQSLSDGRFRIYDEDASAERLTINADGSSVFNGAVTSTGNTTIKDAGVVRLKAAPSGSLYGAGFDVFSVTGSNTSPYTSTTRFGNYGQNEVMVLTGANVNIPNGSLMVGSTTAPTAYTGYSTLALNGTNGGLIEFQKNGVQQSRIANAGGLELQFSTNNTEAMRISSVQNVNIPNGGLMVGATTAPSAKLHVKDTTGSAVNLLRLETGWNSPSGNKSIEWSDATSTLGRISVDYTAGKAKMRFGSLYNSGYQTGDVMTLTADGNVGIGTSLPASYYTGANNLVIHQASGEAGMTISTASDTSGALYFADGSSGDAEYRGGIAYNHSTDVLSLVSGGANRAYIDSSGNVLVGKSVTSSSTAGMLIGSNGRFDAVRDGGYVGYFNRLSSDGDIAVFGKDDTIVGSIGTAGGALVLGNGNAGLYFNSSLSTIMPWGITGNTNRDAAIDIGHSANRFKDLYLSSGVYIGGTGAANKLSDFETGSWTLTDQSGAGMSLTVYVAEYTKIGNKVFFEIGMAFPTTSSTAEIRLSLPFTAKSTTDNTGGATLVGTNSGRNDLWLVNRNSAFFGAGTNLNTGVTNASYSGKQLKLQGAYTAA